MVKRTVEQWQTLFRQHDESEQLASVFCRDKGLCPKYFSKRKKQLGWRLGDISSKVIPVDKPKLVKVKRAKSVVMSAPITMQIRDVSITIPAVQSPQWIASLVKGLNA